MRKVFVVLFLLLTALKLVASAETKPLQAKSVQLLSGLTNNQLIVIDAVSVSGRFLASTKVVPKDDNERKSWLLAHRGHMFAPAWFTKEWKLINLGEPLYGYEYLFNPMPAEIAEDESDSVAMGAFPQVIVRDQTSEICPFAYATASKLMCLGSDLMIEKKDDGSRREFKLPVQANNYVVINNEIWVAASSKGMLLHRLDIETGKFEDHVVDVKQIKAALKEKELKEEDFSDLDLEGKALREDDQDQDSTSDESPNQLYMTTARSFQFKIAQLGSEVFVFLRNPMCLVTLSWPQNVVRSILLLKLDDLPNEFRNYQQIWVTHFDLYNNHPMVWLSATRPMTYASLLANTPDEAQTIKEDWNKAGREREPLKPETVLGVEENHIAMMLGPEKILEIYVVNNATHDQHSAPIGGPFFHLNGKQVWIAVYDKETKKMGLERVL